MHTQTHLPRKPILSDRPDLQRQLNILSISISIEELFVQTNSFVLSCMVTEIRKGKIMDVISMVKEQAKTNRERLEMLLGNRLLTKIERI